MTINVGINGMGRIGRMVIRAIIESQNKNIKIQHINNRSNSEASCTLIKYDSVHGKFNADLDFDKNHLIINKNKITFSQKSKIEDINWKNWSSYSSSKGMPKEWCGVTYYSYPKMWL